LQPTSGDQKQVIRDVINSLSSGGSTHGSAGITTAYELATQHFIEGGTNRVLLATDGDLNVGVTDDDSLVQLIKSRVESGVFLSVLGFGTGNLKDGKLEKIADNGNGQYCYVDSIREAQKVLVAELSGSLVTIAKDVKLQIEFNPVKVAGYRLIGYENRALKNEDFANDRVDAGDIGAGHSVTAFYEIVPVKTVAQPKPAAISGMRYQRAFSVAVEIQKTVDDDLLTDAARSGELMYVALRFKQPESSESDLVEMTVKDSNQSFDAAPADFKFAASVAAFGMKLRQSAYAGNWTWSDIENIAVSTIGDDPQGHRAELVDLVRQARKMLGR
jgi:Ca-activated chloride channel homolog